MAGEWRESTLAQLGRIVTGKTPSTAQPEFYGGNIPFVTPTDFDGRRIIDSTGRYLTDDGANIVASSRIPRDAVMVSCIGSVGKVALSCHDSVTNQQINSIVVNSDNDALFIYYNISWRKAEIKAAARGSVQPILNKTAFGLLDILLPPLPEQRAIAHILGTLDDKIELNRQMSETLEAMARALFKSWFVDFEPVRAKMEGRWRRGESLPGLPAHLYDLFPDRLVDSELGEVPEGWSVGTLGDIADHPRRSVPPHSITADTPYIALEHIPRCSIMLSDWSISHEIESNKFAFKKNELLFGKLRPYFHKVGIAPVDGVCSTDIVVVTPRRPSWFGFVLGHVSSVEFVEYTSARSTGTRMPRTSWADMAQYEVPLPPEFIAGAFTALLQPWINRIIEGIHESRNLAALRDVLLPKLISGELRVRDAERFVAKALA